MDQTAGPPRRFRDGAWPQRLSRAGRSGIARGVTRFPPAPPSLRYKAAPILAALIAAGCVPRTEPTPAPAPRPVPVPAPAPSPTPAADWQDWPWTPGTWTYDRDVRGSRALYGAAGADAAVVVRCDRGARALYLSRAGRATGAFTIRTTSMTRALAVQPTGGALPYVAVRLAADDRLLDAMIFSRGRFTIEQPGTAPTVLPPWAELARVVEDCRG